MNIKEKWMLISGVILISIIIAIGLACQGVGDEDGGDDVTYSISGQVTSDDLGLSGVTITLSGDSSKTTTTDDDGKYSFEGLNKGSYTVTPTLDSRKFYPSSKDVTIQNSAKTDIDFVEDFPPTIVITTPTALSSYSTKNNTIDLSGSASDDINLGSVTWANNQGGSGTATGTDEWTITDIPLQQGDNLITVTATDGGGNTANDSITVAYNPYLEFLSTLQAVPDTIFINEATDVIFRIAIENNPNLDAGSVKLLKVDENNSILETLTTLADDGNVDNGDDIASDGVFSGKANLNEDTEGSIRLRVSADTTEASGSVTSYSDIFIFSVITHLTDDEFTKALSMPDDTKQKYDEFAATHSEDEARKLTVEWLESQPEIVQAGISQSGRGIWYLLDSGVLGGIILNPEGTRGSQRLTYTPNRQLIKTDVNYKAGKYLSHLYKELLSPQSIYATEPEVGSNNVLILGPFHTSFGATSEGVDLENLFNNSQCPTFNVTTIYDAAANVASFKTLSNYGIISIISHGDTFYKGILSGWQEVFGWNFWGAQVIILTGEVATDASKAAYEQDLKKGRLVITGGGYFAVTPAFISYYNSSFPDSMIHAGSCRSKFNNSMASAFIGDGAKTYTGYSEYVLSSYAKNTAITYWTSMVGGKKASEAFNDTITAWGTNDGQATDPAYFYLRGSNDITIKNEDIINGTFEEGTTNGWTGGGDVRVINQLGPLSPQEGVYMSIISTGLGSIGDSDSYVEQTFCIPAGVTTLSFDYNVVSEEPMEWVGSQYDDQFEATLDSTTTGTVTLAKETINTSTWISVGGINFAGGDDTTYQTGWKHITYDVSALAGTGIPVTLKFRTWDKGDSIYDTAALIDNVKLQ